MFFKKRNIDEEGWKHRLPYHKIVDRRIKFTGWGLFILSLFIFLLAIWSPDAGRLTGTGFIFFIAATSQAVWYAIRNT